MSVSKYKDMIEHASPNSIHLPAQHEAHHNYISESSPKHLSSAYPTTGFTSFYDIKAKNQELLFNLHTEITETNPFDSSDHIP